jgi:hypothetical protein
MSILTGAAAGVSAGTGAAVVGVWHGNNAAILCPGCAAQAILVTARPGWRGSDAAHQVPCPGCGYACHLTVPLGPGVGVAVLDVS